VTKTGSYLAKILYLLPLCVLAGFVTFFSVATIASHSFSTDCRNSESPYKFYDFCVYYVGGKIALSADRASLYDAAVQQRYLADLRGSAPLNDKTLVMQCAPFFPCLMIPLVLVPIDTAFAIYFVGSVVAYFGGFFLLTGLLPAKPRAPAGLLIWFLVAFALFGTVPSFITATLGQISNYLFFLVCAYFYCLYQRKDKLAGLFLALSSFKPHYALFWAIPALAQKRWRVIYTAAIVELLLLVMAVATLGWQAVLYYPASIINADNIGSWSERNILMISLRGLLFSISHSPLVFPLTLGVMPLGLVALFFMWRRYTTDDLRAYRWLCAASVILCLFCSVHVYVYDAVLLTIALVLTVDLFKAPGTIEPSKSERFMQLLLLATPYLQWIGLAILPMNYHRSLPTSLILLALSIAVMPWLKAKANKPGHT
jgi:hypothetical protein